MRFRIVRKTVCVSVSAVKKISKQMNKYDENGMLNRNFYLCQIIDGK